MIQFAKWHALRNDFILINERDREPGDPGELARFVCDRREGAGADGLILFEELKEGRGSVRIFNADGSEAGISGNGFRCAAGALFRRSAGKEGHLELTSASGLSRHELMEERGGILEIRSSFGPPCFDPKAIPVDVGQSDPMHLELVVEGESLYGSCVSVGNPHVVFLDRWDEKNWMTIGAAIECDRAFPERTNVEFVRVITRDRLEVLVWERGVGRTASSGTGAAASFSVARRLGLVDGDVRVALEGGELLVRETGQGLEITGMCAEVYRGIIDDPSAEEND